MSPIQQMFLGVGAVATKTYVDDVFSTFLYKGNKPSIQSINNGIQLGNAGVGSVIQSANSGTNGLVISDSDDFQFYNGDFTFEFFSKFNDYGDDPDTIYFQRDNSQDPYVECTFTSGGTIIFLVGGITGDSNKQLEANFPSYTHDKNWHHVAATRSGNTWRLFADGTQIDTLTSSNTSMGNNSTDPKLFNNGSSNETFRGALSSFRIVKGTALYTSNFTPPTAELTAITNTVLLLGVGSTPAVDASGQNHSISTTGTVDSFTSGGPFTSSDAGFGGMVWLKSRTNTYNHILQDSVNGTGKWLQSNTTGGTTNTSQYITSFNANGFSLGTDNDINNSSQDFSSWSFRKAPGFFTIKQYTGSGSTQSISHDLGSVPGMIMVKRTDGSAGWAVFHRGVDGSSPENYALGLDNTDARSESANYWNDDAPTATHFTVKTSGSTNTSGATYIAYVFAGGESTKATARSVKFDNDIDALEIASSSDFGTGTGAFTWEAWVKPADNPTYNPLWMVGNYGDGGLAIQKAGGNYKVVAAGVSNYLYWSHTKMPIGEWTHVAVCRSGSTLKAFLNGTEVHSTTCTYSFASGKAWIGWYGSNMNTKFNGLISNVRWIKGSALYTSSFKPPTEPLTNVTNTKLLCCNNSSVTGSTVTPSTISQIDSSSGCTATTDSPFDDPAGFVFGDAGDQNVIKCGSYIGNGSESDGTEVNIGFEPQWLMVKRTDGSDHWGIIDVMRGWVADGQGNVINPNRNNSEDNGANSALPTSTGFKLHTTNSEWNGSGNEYIYIALRRPDGYVGKPPSLGTDVFAMDTGNSSSTIPTYDSGFPVDFALQRKPAATFAWDAVSRLTSTKYLQTNDAGAESNYTQYTFDSNTGWAEDSGCDATFQSWMWKRHASFDVVTYKGDGVTTGRKIPHSMNKTPEMIWVKSRSASESWYVYHKGLNGGSSPEGYFLRINYANGEAAHPAWIGAPNSTCFTVGSDTAVNANNQNFIAMLFASVDGISKLGTYTGNGSNSGPTVTLGFAPRFILAKEANGSGGWVVQDSLRGIGSGSGLFELNNPAGQAAGTMFSSDSTSFTLVTSFDEINQSGQNYIYYAHA